MSVEPDIRDEPRIRIGELSRRTGVGADTLRAWERRYSVFEPVRSQGGFRLYGARDEDRARRMSELIADGHSAAEAAGAVLGSRGVSAASAGGGTGTEVPLPAGTGATELVEALVGMDAAAANSILDRSFAALSLESAAEGVVLPALREIGERWERGEASVAEEHFASNLLRARLLALARGWSGGGARRAILCCPSGEQHDLGLIVFGLVLRERGWRVTYLGPDTPVADLAATAGLIDPDAVVVSSLDPELVSAGAADLRGLARSQRLLLAGPDDVTALADSLGAEPLAEGPVEAADAVARAG
jgi:methanogenic corrinoid protein MtbC1